MLSVGQPSRLAAVIGQLAFKPFAMENELKVVPVDVGEKELAVKGKPASLQARLA